MFFLLILVFSRWSNLCPSPRLARHRRVIVYPPPPPVYKPTSPSNLHTLPAYTTLTTPRKPPTYPHIYNSPVQLVANIQSPRSVHIFITILPRLKPIPPLSPYLRGEGSSEGLGGWVAKKRREGVNS